MKECAKCKGDGYYYEKDRRTPTRCKCPQGMPSKEKVIKNLQLMIDRLTHGCGNHGCVASKVTGLGTNSFCTCHPHNVKQELGRLIEPLPGHISRWEETE